MLLNCKSFKLTYPQLRTRPAELITDTRQEQGEISIADGHTTVCPLHELINIRITPICNKNKTVKKKFLVDNLILIISVPHEIKRAGNNGPQQQ